MSDFEIFGMNVSVGTMVYQVVLFTVLFMLMRKFVIPKVVKIFEDRRELIEKQLRDVGIVKEDE